MTLIPYLVGSYLAQSLVALGHWYLMGDVKRQLELTYLATNGNQSILPLFISTVRSFLALRFP